MPVQLKERRTMKLCQRDRKISDMKPVAAAGAVLAGLALAGTSLAAAPSASASAAPESAAVIRGELDAVSVASPADAWAVGCSIPDSDLCASDLADHWNGKTWTRVAVTVACGFVRRRRGALERSGHLFH
jgi:invasion protein IalB